MMYTEFLNRYTQGLIDLESSELKIALFSNLYIPSVSHSHYEDLNVKNFEIIGSGYTEGGKPIVLNRVDMDNNRVLYGTGSSVSWDNATFQVRYAILYRISDGLLITCYDLGDQVSDHKKFTLNWANTYLLSLTAESYNLLNLKKSVHQYIIANSDSSYSGDHVNTIQNKAITPMSEESIDEMF